MKYLCCICGCETKPQDNVKCPGLPDEMQVSHGICTDPECMKKWLGGLTTKNGDEN